MPTRLTTLCLAFALTLCLLAGTGCQTFESRWKQAGLQPVTAAPADAAGPLLGRWEGHWESQTTGHEGALRALVEPLDAGRARATFRAIWARVLVHTQTVELTVADAGDALTFQGSADLGRMFGTYQYTGTVRGDEWNSTYQSQHDQGVFILRRVAPTPAR